VTDATPAGNGAEIAIAGVAVLADCDGGLYWPAEKLLVLADLHFEKGTSFAARGVLLPPYDSAATLARIAVLSSSAHGRARRDRWTSASHCARERSGTDAEPAVLCERW
jgi:hypothetical protein